MNYFNKILLKLKIETRFLLEQKWGLKKPLDNFSISKSILKKYLPYNAVIIDCGAHIGADSVELAKIFPEGTIHSFEPIPEVFKQLKYNSRKFPNIKCYQIALSNVSGKALMNVSSGGSDASSSLLNPTGHLHDNPEVLFERTVEVTTLTLDDWAKQESVKAVDFLWLDMQGFEYQMLQASNEILPAVKAIHSEVSMRDTYENGVLYPFLKNWMKTLGLSVISEAIPPNVNMGNVLFVRE